MAANQPHIPTGIPQMPAAPVAQQPVQQANPFAQMQQHFQQQAPAAPASNLGIDPTDPNYDPNRNIISLPGGEGVTQTAPQYLPAQNPALQPQANPVVPNVNPHQQQTLDWNQLQSNLTPDAPVVDNQNAALMELLKNQSTTQQELLERLVNQQNPSTPDYLSMDSQELQALINPEEGGGASKIRDILQAVHAKAVNDSKSQAQQQVEATNAKLEAIERQHNLMQAQYRVNTLKQKYENFDPMFSQNMLDTTKFISTSQGKAIIDADPVNGLDLAYRMVQIQKMNDPQYQAAFAQQQLAVQNNQHIQKLQAGFAGQPTTQNPQSFPQIRQTAQAPQGQSDLDVIKSVLSAGNQVAGGVPNVTVNV